jgi:hypothetical protein
MQDLPAAGGKPLQRRAAAFRREDQRRPADLLARTRVDTRPQRPRNQLRAEANPERGPIRRQSVFQNAQLVLEERIARILVGADRPAKDDQ